MNKAMKIKELRLKTDGELKSDLEGLRNKTRELRFKIYSQETKNVKEIAAVRKDIAKILTLLKERAQ